MHAACDGGHLDVAKWLVAEHGADVRATTNDGWTCLHLACRGGHLDMARWLVAEHGAYVTATDKRVLRDVVGLDDIDDLDKARREFLNWTRRRRLAMWFARRP